MSSTLALDLLKLVLVTSAAKSMISKPIVLCLVIFVVESLIGFLANMFIMVVNGLDVANGQLLSPTDLLLTSLALSRFCFQGILMVTHVMYFFPNVTIRIGTFRSFQVLWMFFNISSLWLATWLCVFYCARIANFSHPLFVYVKVHISQWVPRLLLVSVLLSLACSLSLTTNLDNLTKNNEIFANNTPPLFIGQTFYYPWLIIYISSSAVPFALFWLAATLLLKSLRRHAWQMQRSNAPALQGPMLTAHHSAIKFIRNFFFFYSSYFVALILQVYTTENGASLTCLYNNVVAAYPSLHSVILIISNAKLKQAGARLLHQARGSLKTPTLTLETVSV
ncbi:taste receptor type 2 member 40-like [Microcaecilia unicolor]|uniref:Taste receptor type 2 n=1 Tax=Microcaecilia unicolor TaxID=1415580 RepID=A0A6P7WWU0_9AMPH|nr:taste receptor type 2 member 40-like [Microcaecilia unicolor]